MSRRRIRRFMEGAADASEVQEKLLMNCVRNATGTVYGREHGFSHIRSSDEFRRSVPINSYEDLRPYIDREAGGEKNVLLNPSDRLVMFARTSGTTGRPKLLPITASFRREQQVSFRIWSASCLEHHPHILNGYILAVTDSVHESQTAAGVPVGSISGLIAQRQDLLTLRIYTVPQAVSRIRHANARYYTLMRIALTSDVSFLVTANPSTLLLLARLTDERKESLIRDIHDGELAVRHEVPNHLIRQIRRGLTRNAKRARELENFINKRGQLLPIDYWPNLALIACWKGGPLKLFLNCLPAFYGHVPIRDLGLLASEGRMSIPFSDHGSEAILNIKGAFYEFVPESERQETIGRKTLLAHEVERGRNYYLILTSCNGLFRYDIQDVVRIEGFEGTTPIISFVNKGQHIASITGEKVSEYQIVTAVQEAVRKGAFTRFIVCPAWDILPYYTVITEELDAQRVNNWAVTLEAIDHRLRELNVEYASKRNSGRIDSMRLTLVPNGTLASMNSICVHDSQFKQIYLRSEIDYHRRYPHIGQIYSAGATSQEESRTSVATANFT